jgi:hypothetical protein
VGKARQKLLSVLVNAALEIIGHSGVKHRVTLVRQNMDIVLRSHQKIGSLRGAVGDAAIQKFTGNPRIASLRSQ